MDGTRKTQYFKSGDLAITLIVLLLAGGWLVFSGSRWNETGSSMPDDLKALIFHQGKKLETRDLSINIIKTILDGRMLVESKNGKIRVLESDCPRQICVQAGWIGMTGETLVCAPNQVIIEIKQGKRAPRLDAVVQ